MGEVADAAAAASTSKKAVGGDGGGTYPDWGVIAEV